MGPWYRRLGRGVDSSPVDATPYVARGHGREMTFQQNLTDWDEIEAEVRRLAARVTEDIRAEGRPAVRVGMKVRYAPFITTSRSLTLEQPTDDAEVIAAAALELFGRLESAAGCPAYRCTSGNDSAERVTSDPTYGDELRTNGHERSETQTRLFP